MGEVWRDAVGFEGYYQVSNLGRIRSVDRMLRNGRYMRGKVLSESQDAYGYQYRALNVNGKQYPCKVHRFVAAAFIPNPSGLPQVNHKNGNKTDNRVENLEWVSHQENARHAYENGLVHAPPPRMKLTDEDVSIIRELYALIRMPHGELGKVFGVSGAHITNIINGKYRKVEVA